MYINMNFTKNYRSCMQIISTLLVRVFIKPKVVLNPYVLYQIIRYYNAMSRRDLDAVNEILSKIRHHNIYFFLSAHYLYYFGNYSKANLVLNRFLDIYPDHAESIYLLSRIFLKLNQHQKALEILYSFLHRSKRVKTWLYLSRAIENKEQFSDFDQCFRQFFSPQKISNWELLRYYSDAAVKVGQYDKAIQQWIMSRDYIEENNIHYQKRYKKISVESAKQALLHLKIVFDSQNIEFFLISGTLLGAIRDNGILPHDKDLDVGIFEDNIKKNDVVRICETAGCFDVVFNNKYLIKLKHINGTFIDIFIHYEDSLFYYHSTSKIIWKNLKFNIIKKSFLGGIFNIPEKYIRYLSENYGDDWFKPKINFDSTFDTPNAKILNKEEVKVYLYRRIFENILYKEGNDEFLGNQLRQLAELKE